LLHNKNSLQQKLIFYLSTLAIVTLVIASIMSFIFAKREINEMFDSDMIKTSNIIFKVITHDNFIHNAKNLDDQLPKKFFKNYDYEIHIQAWKNEQLLYNSSDHFLLDRPVSDGFSMQIHYQQIWRIYNFFEKQSQIQITLAEKNDIRQKLIYEILISAILPFFFAFVIMIAIIGYIVKFQVKSLENIAKKISKISVKDLKSANNFNVPKELTSLVKSFNDLLFRLDNAIENEKKFTDYAAHELNTPLSIIKLQTQILLKQNNSLSTQQHLENLLTAIDRSIHLVSQLLTLSRLQTDDKNSNFEKFNFSQLLTAFVNNYLKLTSFNNLSLNYQINNNNDNFVINGNKLYFEILLKNIFDNALKYSHKNTAINCILSSHKKHLSLTLTNIGDNLCKDEIEKIFNNFFRAKNSYQTQQLSSGLGLGIVKRIIDLHHGSVKFSSQNNLNSLEISIPKSI